VTYCKHKILLNLSSLYLSKCHTPFILNPPVNSPTIGDHFPGLSRDKNSGLSKIRGNPVTSSCERFLLHMAKQLNLQFYTTEHLMLIHHSNIPVCPMFLDRCNRGAFFQSKKQTNKQSINAIGYASNYH